MQDAKVIDILSGPLAQQLLHSDIPARLAYIAPDATPRVVPIAFVWTGAAMVMCTLPNAAKVTSLTANPAVALTVDTNAFPPHILLVRGTAALEVVDGVPDEYLAASRKLVGDDGMEQFETQVRGLYTRMVRITVTPTWAKLLDFETTLPTAVEELLPKP